MARKPAIVRKLVDIENTDELDEAVAKLRPLIMAVAGNDTVRDLLQGKWFGHALHPAVVAVPLGLWTSATTLDLLKPGRAADASTLLVGLGVLAAVPAALTGAAEISEAPQKQKRVGVIHVLANTSGLVCQTLSFVARKSGHHRTGAGLSLVAVGFAGWGGYLGGHMSIARKVGTYDPAFGPEGSAGVRRAEDDVEPSGQI